MLAYLVEIVILCYYQARLLDIGLVSTVAQQQSLCPTLVQQTHSRQTARRLASLLLFRGASLLSNLLIISNLCCSASLFIALSL